MGSRNLSTEPSSCSRATRVDRKENIAKKDEADLRAESAATSAPCCCHKKRSAAVWSEATGMDDRRVRCYKRPLLQPQKTLCSGLERSDRNGRPPSPLLQAPLAAATKNALQRSGAKRQEWTTAESAATSAPCCSHKKRSAAVWSEATGMDDRRVRCYKCPLLQPQKALCSGLERSDNYKLLPPPRISVIASGAATPPPRLAPLVSSTVSPSPGARNKLVSR